MIWTLTTAALLACLGPGQLAAQQAPPPNPSPASSPSQRTHPARGPWVPLAEDMAGVLERKRIDLDIPGLAIAVSVDGELVWALATGEAARGRFRPGPQLTLDHVWRCGEVTQLVTDWLLGAQIKAGTVQRDAPLQELLPFWWEAEGSKPVTVLQLIQRQSPLQFQPPVGHVGDPQPATLETVAGAIAATPRRRDTDWRWFHNHSGHALLGHVLERIHGQDFPSLAAEQLFAPLELTSTGIGVDSLDRDAPRVVGELWTPDGRRIPTPEHPIGASSSLGLVSTLPDLVRLGEQRVALADRADSGERTSIHQVLRAANRLRGRDGSVAGQSVLLKMDYKNRVVIAAAANVAFGDAVLQQLVQRVEAHVAAVRGGDPVAPMRVLRPVGRDLARRLTGRYLAPGLHLDLTPRGEELYLSLPNMIPMRVRESEGHLWADDRLLHGAGLVTKGWQDPANLAAGRIRVTGKDAQRQALPWTSERLHGKVPAGRRRFLGEYGDDHQRVIVFEDRNQLTALVDWVFLAPLLPDGVGAVFRVPSGRHAGDPVVFELPESGPATAVEIGGVRYPRIPMGAGEGQVFRIEPLRPPEELRALAAAAAPPAQPDGLLQPDLVELRGVDPAAEGGAAEDPERAIRYDIRYATADNFMGFPLYEVPKAKLQRPAAAALVRAHQRLAPNGLGLVVHDAYRPWSVTKMFWEATPDPQKGFVANPETGSRHNRGCAVDVSLYRLDTGEPVEMPSGYDEFTPRAFAHWPGGTRRQRHARELLQQAMTAEGFDIIQSEWWHFDYRGWQRYPVMNVPLK